MKLLCLIIPQLSYNVKTFFLQKTIPESPKVIARALDAGYEPISFLLERKHIDGQARDILNRCEDIPVYTADLDVLTKLTGFRSAAALNIDAVLLTPGCSNPLYRRATRISMGTVFQIPWTYLKSSSADCPGTDIRQLKELGFQTAAMALSDDSVSIADPRLAAEEKLAIVLGTEGDGLASSTISDCDYTVRIPMSHGVDSLNVAAASAVAFWELGRR